MQMGPVLIDLKNLQSFIFFQAGLQLLAGKSLAQNHGLGQFEFHRGRLGSRGIIPQNIKDARHDVFSFAILAFLLFRQARLGHVG